VVAAGCVFPLTQQAGLSTQLGMRHRAAIGLSEETDAVIIVVSEETGMISAARGGRLRQGLDEEGLRKFLMQTLATQSRSRNWFVDPARRFLGSLISTRPSNPNAAPTEGFSEVPNGEPTSQEGKAGQ
jgi:hypothetical protein